MRLFVPYSSTTLFARFSAGLALVLVAGCAGSSTPPPAVEIRTVTVDRVVAVQCVKLSDLPPEPAKIGNRLTGDASRDLDMTAASAVRLRSWGLVLNAMLRACAG